MHAVCLFGHLQGLGDRRRGTAEAHGSIQHENHLMRFADSDLSCTESSQNSRRRVAFRSAAKVPRQRERPSDAPPERPRSYRDAQADKWCESAGNKTFLRVFTCHGQASRCAPREERPYCVEGSGISGSFDRTHIYNGVCALQAGRSSLIAALHLENGMLPQGRTELRYCVFAVLSG